jgi:Flp pilus assembly protein TadG
MNDTKKLKRLLGTFRVDKAGNAAVTFALLLVPMVGAVGAAVDYSQANSMKTSMQAAADATALSLVSQAGTLTSTQLSTTASSYFLANFNRPQAKNVSVGASYDSTTATLTISASAATTTSFLGTMGFKTVALSATSSATTAGKMYTICVMITNPTDGHTEITSNGAGLVFNNCMNQVNTDNWDAVQADDNSYIQGTAGDNCFVGNIHFGNVTPPKDASCTIFPDPFASYTMPVSARSCDYGNPPAGSTKSAANKAMPAGTTTTWSPGTYCGNVNIAPANGSTVTLNPGVYIINAGTLTMKNNINVTANGVTILLTGHNAALNFQNVNLNMTPSTSAGDFSNFLFFLDQSGCTTQSNGTVSCPFNDKSQWQNVTMNTNGIIYLSNQEFDIQSGTKSPTPPTALTLNPGSLIAGLIVPSGNLVFTVTGYSTGTSGAPSSLQKTGSASQTPRLVK